MILIEEILVSEDLVDKHFACDLKACKGICCVEGDFGAPLEQDEVLILEKILKKVLPFVPEKSQKVIEKKGFSKIGDEGPETTLMKNGACVFMGQDKEGISYCSIEKAYEAGAVEFRKPISCHLYPIRVTKNPKTGFVALNYDRWDICKPATRNGKKIKLKIYEFNKEAIIRAYGEDVYEHLKAADEQL